MQRSPEAAIEAERWRRQYLDDLIREDILEFSRVHELRAMLIKHAHYLQDVGGRNLSLHYVRDKEGREVDFVLCEAERPIGFAECKLADASVSPYLAALAERFPGAGAVQLVRDLRQP